MGKLAFFDVICVFLCVTIYHHSVQAYRHSSTKTPVGKRIHFFQLSMMKVYILETFLMTMSVPILSMIDFSKNILQQQKQDDFSSPATEWITKKRDIGRFLDSNPIVKFSMQTLSVVAGILTIWIFAESRHKSFEEPYANDLLEEWNSQLQDFNFQLQYVKHSLQQLTCRFEAVHAKYKDISQECLQFIHQVSTKISPFEKSSHPKANYLSRKQ